MPGLDSNMASGRIQLAVSCNAIDDTAISAGLIIRYQTSAKHMTYINKKASTSLTVLCFNTCSAVILDADWSSEAVHNLRSY